MTMDAPFAASSGVPAEVLRARTRLLYDQLPFVILSNTLVMCGVAALLWNRHPQAWQVLIWLSAGFVFSPLRWLLLRHYWRLGGEDFDIARWLRLYTGTAAAAGVLLSLAGVLFFHDDTITVAVLAVAIGIMSLGSVLVHAAYAPAHTAYLLGLLPPFALRCLFSGDAAYMALGAGVALLVPINLVLFRRSQTGMTESIELRLRNQALIEELRKQKERAEQVNAAKTRFFAAVSHDLRQPVQALELFSAALLRELGEHPARHLATSIRSLGRELDELLGTLLDFVRIDAAVVKPVIQDFPLADLLRRMEKEFSLQAGAQGLRLRVVPCRAWVRSDQVLLERILRNLVGNALKYTRSGRILLGCRRVGGGVRIEVHDTGIGIPADQQQEIFKEFVQLANPERDRHKGLGLGLSIVSGLAGLLAHPVGLRSELRRGSCFSITLPLGVASGAARPQEQEETPILEAADEASVLLIDDDQAIREAVNNLLQGWGHAVVVAESEQEALELLGSTGFLPDVLLVDFRLRQGRTGLQAIEAVRAYCGKKIPAAIVTGDAASEELDQARAAGFALLHKPLSAARLRMLIADLLRA